MERVVPDSTKKNFWSENFPEMEKKAPESPKKEYRKTTIGLDVSSSFKTINNEKDSINKQTFGKIRRSVSAEAIQRGSLMTPSIGGVRKDLDYYASRTREEVIKALRSPEYTASVENYVSPAEKRKKLKEKVRNLFTKDFSYKINCLYEQYKGNPEQLTSNLKDLREQMNKEKDIEFFYEKLIPFFMQNPSVFFKVSLPTKEGMYEKDKEIFLDVFLPHAEKMSPKNLKILLLNLYNEEQYKPTEGKNILTDLFKKYSQNCFSPLIYEDSYLYALLQVNGALSLEINLKSIYDTFRKDPPKLMDEILKFRGRISKKRDIECFYYFLIPSLLKNPTEVIPSQLLAIDQEHLVSQFFAYLQLHHEENGVRESITKCFVALWNLDKKNLLRLLLNKYLDSYFNPSIFEDEKLLRFIQAGGTTLGESVLKKTIQYLKGYGKTLNVLRILTDEELTIHPQEPFRGESMIIQVFKDYGNESFSSLFKPLELIIKDCFKKYSDEVNSTNKALFLELLRVTFDKVFDISSISKPGRDFLKMSKEILQQKKFSKKEEGIYIGAFYLLRIINPYLTNLKDLNSEEIKIIIVLTRALQSIVNKSIFNEYQVEHTWINEHLTEYYKKYDEFITKIEQNDS